MDTIVINEPQVFPVYESCLPDNWLYCSFDNIDFSTKQELKNFLIEYFKYFKIQDCLDSLIMYNSDLAYRILIATYKEVSKRLSVDNYRFISWHDVLSVSNYEFDSYINENVSFISFLFLFDVTLLTKDSIRYFISILNYCYINNIKLLCCTRHDELFLSNVIDSSIMSGTYNKKFINIKINSAD